MWLMGMSLVARLLPRVTRPRGARLRPLVGDTFAWIPLTAMETNDLGFVASLLFILVPAIFLIVLYIGTQNSEA